MLVGQLERFLLRKARVLLAFFVIASTWEFQFVEVILHCLAGSGCHVSSVKSQEMESAFLGMSFMYSRNKKGLSTLPCGTSELTGAGPDRVPDPHKEVATDAMLWFYDQQLVGYLVECLAKQDHTNLLSLV
ncbi:hypothetical protein LSAT2_015276 [Lamellibrachia satsuma]|nr:hypothetical protein LSAT2_015276 [Lamellibrachia satsuma]